MEEEIGDGTGAPGRVGPRLRRVGRQPLAQRPRRGEEDEAPPDHHVGEERVRAREVAGRAAVGEDRPERAEDVRDAGEDLGREVRAPVRHLAEDQDGELGDVPGGERHRRHE